MSPMAKALLALLAIYAMKNIHRADTPASTQRDPPAATSAQVCREDNPRPAAVADWVTY
jgi:hypothetical protein